MAEAAASSGEVFRRAWATQSTELAEAFFKLNTEVKPGMPYLNHPWTEWASGKGFQGHTIGNTCIVKDGELEIVVSLKDGVDAERQVFVYSVPGSGTQCLPWPTGRANLRRSGTIGSPSPR